jgi:hypothetical protein
MTDTAPTFDAFLEQAWADHGDRAEEVAQRLEQGYRLIENPAQIAPLARILAHVDGEHLARWDEGVARLERLRAHPRWRDDGDGAITVRRLIAALVLGGGGQPGGTLTAADYAHGHAVAAAAHAAQRSWPKAVAHFRAALAAAAEGLPDRDPAIRALAVASNNLAAALEEMPSRTPDLTPVMLEVAQAAREYWGRAGGWLETERAEYMLAKCHLAAGDATGALLHAQQCAAICEANDADALEHFFAQATLAVVYRALGDARQFAQAKTAALARYATLPAEQKKWCDAMLKELG